MTMCRTATQTKEARTELSSSLKQKISGLFLLTNVYVYSHRHKVLHYQCGYVGVSLYGCSVSVIVSVSENGEGWSVRVD